MPKITPRKGGFVVSHSTREVWGVDDPCENRAAFYVPGTRVRLCREHAPAYQRLTPGALLCADASLDCTCTWDRDKGAGNA